MNMLIAITVGGAGGALLRHAVSAGLQGFAGSAFPVGILAVNVLGCTAIGAFAEGSSLVFEVSKEIRALVVTGFLGAFTTFSAFALETALLFERGNPALAALYIALSVFLCIGGFYVGSLSVRSFFT